MNIKEEYEKMNELNGKYLSAQMWTYLSLKAIQLYGVGVTPEEWKELLLQDRETVEGPGILENK